MAKISELAGMLRELEDQLITCMRCGLCQAACPLFAETGLETDVARGKLALLDGLAREILSNPRALARRLDRCLLCSSCEANCPSGVGTLDIFLKARAVLAGYLGLSPLKKAIFSLVLANPGLFHALLSIGSRVQNLFTKPVNEALGSSRARFPAPYIRDRHFRTLASKPFHELFPGGLETPAPTGGSGLKVAFYTGCLVDRVFPEIGEAVLKALEHHRAGLYIPEGQACCGIPALAGGDSDTFRKLVSLNLELFHPERFDYLVTACATCTMTIKKLWPAFCKGTENSGLLALISEKTMDINQFLADILGVKPAAVQAGSGPLVTYHDPCHLVNSLGLASEPRAVVRANPSYSFTELEDADSCCGCGGSFNLLHYGISASIGRRKAENILASGAEIVATGCPACMLQITDMLSRAGAAGVRVKHTVELYAESLEQAVSHSIPADG